MTSGTKARMYVHRAESGHALVAGLAAVLAEPPDDPFVPDLIAVPTQGIERWLAQQLSHHLGASAAGQDDGVCANVAFPHPNDILDQAVAATSPEHAKSVQDWHPARTVWPLVDLLADIATGTDTSTDDRFALLRHHLTSRQDTPTGRRYALGRRITTLFADYGASRPELIRSWAAGTAEDLPDDLSWQPLLWLSLREALGPSPAELLDDALAAIRAGTTAIDLPPRISVYGPSRIDASRLSVLAALATHRDVHLWLNHASPALWQQLRAQIPAEADDRRRTSNTARPRNPLLASLSRDIRELQQRLTAVAPDFTDIHHETPPSKPATLLQRLQSDLRNDFHTSDVRARDDQTAATYAVLDPADLRTDFHADDSNAADHTADPYVLDPADRTIQVHSCHGRSRQVEVLREVILGLLADDTTLEPRDILVMCPDVDTFAPLVTAAFGTAPADQLRVRLADRAPRESNSVLAVVLALLRLVAGRVGAPELLDLAGMPPVRTRFGFDDDDLEQIRTWTVEAAAHWGLDSAHRSAWGMSALAEGTWRTSLDRLLTGVALGDGDHLFGDVLPVAGVDSGDIDLVGRFAELVDRVDAAATLLSTEQSLLHWLDALEQATISLADVGRDQSWEILQFRAELGAIRESAADAGLMLTLADVRTLFETQLAGRPTRSSFRSGGITVCTLVPMRSVPHRVICLLGLDDEAFPRRSRPDGDDLLARDPHLGERDPRSEDRQLFLDALTATTEHLIVTYRGAHERTGARLNPAVPVGELLDALDDTASAPDGGRVRDHVVVRHPLQPADPRNFTPGALGRAAPFSFDPSALAGARSGVGPRASRPEFLVGSLPSRTEPEAVELDLLQRFWAHPVRGFLRQRLELGGDFTEDQPDEAMPLEVDSLEQWAIGDRILDALRRGREPQAILGVELARGELPPGPLGQPVLQTTGRRAGGILEAAGPWLAPDGRPVPNTSVDVDLALPHGRRLVGTIRGLYGPVLLQVIYSRVAPKHRLRAWIDLLTLTASDPETPWTAVIVGRGSREQISIAKLGAVSADDAAVLLQTLVSIRDMGLTSALPLPLKTSHAYVTARRDRADPSGAIERAKREWLTTYRFGGEDADAEHERVSGPHAPIETLLDWVAPGPLVEVDGETTDFGRLATMVWRPLLDHEAESQR